MTSARGGSGRFGVLQVILVAYAVIKVVVAQTAATCSPDKLCPKENPCCSLYGSCSTGAYCLGGCDPKSSFSLDACMPRPICKSQDYRFTDLKSLVLDQSYLGNASSAGWVFSGTPAMIKDESGDEVLLLTMPKDSGGTLISSSSYIWYGKISATLRTSRSPGVVTAFILMSDVKDEIDFEFVGYDTNQGQTNFYWQGVTNYTNGRNHTVDDTFDNYHTYEVDWTPDYMHWSVDGNVIRSVNKVDTFNATSNLYEFPQTPARVSLSLWPAGTSQNAPGTIQWAGGMVDWNYQDVQNAGYFYSLVKDVNIQCYDPPSGAKESGDQAYIYNDKVGLNNSISIVNANTIMKSLLATGLDPNIGAPDNTNDTSATVPSANGLNGANANQQSGTVTGADAPAGSDYYGFSQGTTKTSDSMSSRVNAGITTYLLLILYSMIF